VAVKIEGPSSIFNLPMVPSYPVRGHTDSLHLWPRSQR